MIKKNTDPISMLILESDSYREFDQIEKLVDQKNDLSVLPVQPVYLALKTLPIEKVATLLPRFSKEQREVFLDIDLWVKDEIDVRHFPFWLMAYNLTEDESVKKEFVTSEQFLIFLKSKFNIWTFDAEEPEYPDHDNYFLTDDALLLFEFEENYPFLNEVRELIKHLYYELGVENAYSFLFKLVSDSYLTLQEDEFRLRNERQRDFGFVNYLDALEIENAFIKLEFLEKFVKDKKPITPDLTANSKNQNLHNSALIAFKDKFSSVAEELLMIKDQKRLDYLQFNFIRLINGRLESTEALKKGSVAMGRSGAQTKNVILLGHSYLKSPRNAHLISNFKDESIFERFDFTELYRIGNSLLLFNKKYLKKSLAQTGFDTEESESFLGDYWSQFLDDSFDVPIKFLNGSKLESEVILDFETYELWTYKTKTLVGLLPFAQSLYKTFKELKTEGKLLDHYYLNYKVDEINFESLLMTSFANYVLLNYKDTDNLKIGLVITEYVAFAKQMINVDGKFVISASLYTTMQNFFKHFGLDLVYDINQYLQDLIKNSLEGYDFINLKEEDYRHVGGPIILAINRQ